MKNDTFRNVSYASSYFNIDFQDWQYQKTIKMLNLLKENEN